VPEPPLLNGAEEAGHHYLRRWQIWAPVNLDVRSQTPEWHAAQDLRGGPSVQFAWQPYDRSAIPSQTTAPREDVKNFFYLDIRYRKQDGNVFRVSTPALVLTSSQRSLTWCSAISAIP